MAHSLYSSQRPEYHSLTSGCFKAHSVDFKFGKKRKAYNKQVKEYMDLLSDMGYEHIRGYLWYVFKNELEEIE